MPTGVGRVVEVCLRQLGLLGDGHGGTAHYGKNGMENNTQQRGFDII
jgi:hypothetical protein